MENARRYVQNNCQNEQEPYFNLALLQNNFKPKYVFV